MSHIKKSYIAGCRFFVTQLLKYISFNRFKINIAYRKSHFVMPYGQ